MNGEPSLPGSSNELHPDYVPDEVVRVLLIDDDQTYHQLCHRYLAKYTEPKYELVSVPSASQGIAQCQAHSFDCLLIDYRLPDLSGIQVFRRLNDILSHFTPPAIILTADGGEDAAGEALRAGATDYMPKRVVSPKSLVRAIGNAVEKSRLRNSIEARRRELHRVNQVLQSKNDEIQRFYQSVSHEVKTPLTAAREFIAIVRDGIAGPVTNEQANMLGYALESCDQITAHFNDLVEMTRLEAQKITLKKHLTSLHKVFIRCQVAVSSAIKAKNIDLNATVTPDFPPVFIDENRVVQVLSNLLGNAIKYTDANGRITLSATQRSDDVIQIAVSDNGCGISELDLPQVFDRLYQVENGGDHSLGAGLGLGLSIAKEIALLHGGDIQAESIVSKGSTFTLCLPIAPPNCDPENLT